MTRMAHLWRAGELLERVVHGMADTHRSGLALVSDELEDVAELRIGLWGEVHHVEKQVIKVDDPNSPLSKAFGSASFQHTDEFCQFPP